ncbi:hypothetical protein PISL3812_02741 [Talaromyces islandicus]|uniref:Uncharacterized protein n=1 Tax=Talaromyces islandicus TaxID=28573 RepID=A0A0U1LT16_TALIS|nr:hypothetical protein PISL3812_02741 [Talaromyces islandicus]
MPPIRTFNSAPINQNTSPTAAKQENNNNATPSQQDEQQQPTPFAAPVTTTAAPTTSVNMSAARPGAPAVPGPTAAPVPAPTKTYPSFDAGGDTSTSTNTPAAPQPGARPVPLAATPTGKKTSYAVPPPPKTGEPVRPAEYYAPKTQQPTTTSSAPARYHPGQGGGLMNSGGTSAIAQEEVIITTATNVPNSTSTPYMSTYQPPSAQPLPSPSLFTSIGSSNSNSSNAGPLYESNDGEDSILGESGQKVLDTAKSWMQSAGNKLAEAEAEVWKMVNSK